MKKILLGIIALVFGLMMYFEFSRIPSRTELPGKFDEVAFVRNENNLGTVKLYYAFTAEEPLNADLKALGKTLQYNKHSGMTTAFVFDVKKGNPKALLLEFPHFDTVQYKPFKVYFKDKVGNEFISTWEDYILNSSR